jgi:hypothetical protein
MGVELENDKDRLLEICDNDVSQVRFVEEWLKNGRNATAAYQKLHPKASRASASVIGCRKLSKVNTQTILSLYGLSIEKYFEQLRDGVSAEKWNEFSGEREADHKTRRDYHKVLGKLLGVENDDVNVTVTKFSEVLNRITYEEIKPREITATIEVPTTRDAEGSDIRPSTVSDTKCGEKVREEFARSVSSNLPDVFEQPESLDSSPNDGLDGEDMAGGTKVV